MEDVLSDGAARPARPARPGAALELLVHGVGGTTPEQMLGDPRTVRITGDDTAAVHRRADDVDAENGPGGAPDRPVPEAYVWCNLTSGNGSRALWLLLLPFMVVNLAHWMRPPAHEHTRLVRLYGLLVRLAGLTLTVLLVAAACEVALDLTAWQCAGTRACAERHTWLGFLSPALSHGGWWSMPGRRLALAALVPTALTVLLWYLSHRTWRAYESREPLTRAPEAEHQPGPTALGRPGFWYGRRLVARLRAAHTAAGLLTVAAAVGTAAAREDRRPGGPALLDALGWCLVAALVGGAAAVVWVVCRRGRSEHRLDRALDAHLVRRLPLATLVLLGLTTVYAGWSRPGWHDADRLPGDTTFGALALGQGLTVLALALVAALLHRAAAGEGRPRSSGAGVTAATAARAVPQQGPVPGQELRRARSRPRRAARPPPTRPPPPRPGRPVRARRPRRRHAGLRPRGRDVRRGGAAGRRLAGRHAELPRRPARPADLAGVRDPTGPAGAPHAGRAARPRDLASRPRRTRRGAPRLRHRRRR